MHQLLAAPFVESFLASVPARIFAALEGYPLEGYYYTFLEAELAKIGNLKFSKPFFNFIKRAGTTPADFTYKAVKTRMGTAILSLRFYRGDSNRPFVQVIASDYTLDRDEHLLEVYHLAKQAYGIFNVDTIRFFSPGSQITAHVEKLNLKCDFEFYVGMLGRILRTESQLPDGYYIRKESGAEFFDCYERAYLDLARTRPFITSRSVWMEDKEEILRLAGQGLVYSLFYKESWAGVMILEHREEFCLNGYCVNEFLIVPNHQSRRLAQPFQNSVLGQSGIESNKLIFGHIIKENLWASSAALRNNRVLLGGYFFMHVA